MLKRFRAAFAATFELSPMSTLLFAAWLLGAIALSTHLSGWSPLRLIGATGSAAAPPVVARSGDSILTVQLSDPLHSIHEGDYVTLILAAPSATPAPASIATAVPTVGSQGAGGKALDCAAAAGTGEPVLCDVLIISLNTPSRLSVAAPGTIAARVAVPVNGLSYSSLSRFVAASTVYPIYTK
jgi:hypothetical protein